MILKLLEGRKCVEEYQYPVIFKEYLIEEFWTESGLAYLSIGVSYYFTGYIRFIKVGLGYRGVEGQYYEGWFQNNFPNRIKLGNWILLKRIVDTCYKLAIGLNLDGIDSDIIENRILPLFNQWGYSLRFSYEKDLYIISKKEILLIDVYS